MVAEVQISMDEVAHGLHARPSRRGLAKAAPGFVGQKIGIAVAAAPEIDERLVGQFLHGMLSRGRGHRIGQPGIVKQPVRGQGKDPLGGDHARAPVAESVAVARERHGGRGDDVVPLHRVHLAAVMDTEHRDQRCRLVQGKLEAATDPDQHGPLGRAGCTVRLLAGPGSEALRCGGTRTVSILRSGPLRSGGAEIRVSTSHAPAGGNGAERRSLSGRSRRAGVSPR